MLSNHQERTSQPAKRVAAITLGCKLNYAETSAILDQLWHEGWELSTIEAGADLIIIHTCAVTQQAEKKCRQKIRSLIKKYPESQIAVIGCYAQLQKSELFDIHGINAILGSADKFELSWYNALAEKKKSDPLVHITPAHTLTTIYPGYSLPASMGNERTRAFLKIQDGCDYGCSYCTIPLLRGASRSLPIAAILERATLLAASGYREIVLTGVNIGDYTADGKTLCDLLRELEHVAINRIRISSLEPDIVTDELLALIATSRNIVPHLHLPLQSGSDAILKAMRRRYNTAMYREKVEKAVMRLPDCSIGADVMVGYPGETEEDFLQMYRFIEELPLAYLHVFSYSLRPGTALAEQIDRGERKLITPEEIGHRYQMLTELGHRKEAEHKTRAIGKTSLVLFEQTKSTPHGKAHGKVQCSGYTRNYLNVVVESNDRTMIERLKGNEVLVHIDSLDDDLNLKGRVLSL
jgi:threonylcarbamoyladenosine tRNA methylthiotransferase MtaB